MSSVSYMIICMEVIFFPSFLQTDQWHGLCFFIIGNAGVPFLISFLEKEIRKGTENGKPIRAVTN